jgi:hypothetical protein
LGGHPPEPAVVLHTMQRQALRNLHDYTSVAHDTGNVAWGRFDQGAYLAEVERAIVRRQITTWDELAVALRATRVFGSLTTPSFALQLVFEWHSLHRRASRVRGVGRMLQSFRLFQHMLTRSIKLGRCVGISPSSLDKDAGLP